MPPSTYEPLQQDRDEFSQGDSAGSVHTAYPPKPETYYGDGPFDPPSSDDEADELLEKTRERDGRSIEEDGGLVLGGGQKVCLRSCRTSFWP